MAISETRAIPVALARLRSLIVACHPGPSLAITAMVTLLTAQAAPHGFGPLLVTPAIAAGQISTGWSNDAFDAARDGAAGRTDKPIPAGAISARAVWIAAFCALATALALSLTISLNALVINSVLIGAGWAYNAGLKSTWASGLMYLAGFAPIPAFAACTLPGRPIPAWWATGAAGAVGLGAHFANVLPDLAGDRLTGVNGLPQIVADRWGARAVRVIALALLLLASLLLVLAGSPSRRWVSLAGLGVSAVLAVAGFRGSGRLPFLAALGIAAVDVVLFAVGGDTLT